VRNAEALERFERVDTLVLDKTGTLTAGRPEIVDVSGDDEMLRLAASLEQGSEHPLASAIVRAAKARNLALVPGATFESVTGRGVAGRVGDHEVVVGNADLLRERGVPVGEDMDAVAQRTQGRTLVHVAVDGRAAGRLAVADPIKPGARDALAALAADGLRIVMLTGDARDTAVAVAAELGIAPADVIAGVLPANKREVVRDLQAHGAVVAMAGDGVNDAPALAEAAVGIAMGTGTDVAMESAGITLVSGDVRALVRARRLSRDTMRNIRQNLFLAFAYNVIGVPVAAGVLYPLVGVLISPIWASAAMTFSSVSVIGNALRLRRG
jgi:Cu+-exporting ATPase